MVSVSTVASNLMELEGRSSEKFGLGSGDRGRQPEGGSVSDLREGLKVYGRDWVRGLRRRRTVAGALACETLLEERCAKRNGTTITRLHQP